MGIVNPIDIENDSHSSEDFINYNFGRFRFTLESTVVFILLNIRGK